MPFSLEIALAVIITFFFSYYLGWWARGKWEEKKHVFVKDSKRKEKWPKKKSK